MSDVFPNNLKKVLWNVRPKGDRNTSLMVMTSFGKTSIMIMQNNNRVFITDVQLGVFSFAKRLLCQAAAAGKAVTYMRPIEEYKDRERKRIGDLAIKMDDQLNSFFCISCAAGAWEFPIWGPQINLGQCDGVSKIENAQMTIAEWADNLVQKGRVMEVLTGIKRPQGQQQQGNGTYNGNPGFGGGGGGNSYGGGNSGGGAAAPSEKSLDDEVPF